MVRRWRGENHSFHTFRQHVHACECNNDNTYEPSQLNRIYTINMHFVVSTHVPYFCFKFSRLSAPFRVKKSLYKVVITNENRTTEDTKRSVQTLNVIRSNDYYTYIVIAAFTFFLQNRVSITLFSASRTSNTAVMRQTFLGTVEYHNFYRTSLCAAVFSRLWLMTRSVIILIKNTWKTHGNNMENQMSHFTVE